MSATHADAFHLVKAMLGGHISAMSDGGNRGPADKAARARDLWAVIASCEPQDAIQTLLIGQALMFNELIADGGRGVLAGMMDTLKLRAQSNLNGMNRALHQNVAMFLRLRDKSDAAAATNAAVTETVEAAQRRLDSAKRPAETPPPAQAIRPAANGPHRAPETAAINVSARADAYGKLNGTHASVLAMNAVADPSRAKPLFRHEAAPPQPRPELALLRELTETS